MLDWVINTLSAAGIGLKRGEILSTGTCTGMVPLKPGQTAVADFGALGRIEVCFT